jgi:hypothetical protein
VPAVTLPPRYDLGSGKSEQALLHVHSAYGNYLAAHRDRTEVLSLQRYQFESEPLVGWACQVRLAARLRRRFRGLVSPANGEKSVGSRFQLTSRQVGAYSSRVSSHDAGKSAVKGRLSCTATADGGVTCTSTEALW